MSERPSLILAVPALMIAAYLFVPTESWVKLGRRLGLEGREAKPGELLGAQGAAGLAEIHAAADKRDGGAVTLAEARAALALSNPPAVRMSAMLRSRFLPDAALRELVTIALNDPYPGVRRQAFLACGVPARIPITELGVSLANDPDPDVKSRWDRAVQDAHRR